MLSIVFYLGLMICVIMGDYFLVVLFMSFIILSLISGGTSYLSTFVYIDLFSWSLSILLSFMFMVMIMGSINSLGEDMSFRFFFFVLGSLIFFLYICFFVSSYFLFYLAFECSVVPIFLVIMGWGFSHERLQAGMYLFIYTLLMSLPFLLFLISLSEEDGLTDYLNSPFYYGFKSGFLWALMSMMVFLIKFPLYGFHLWLPKAHVEAPLSGSMVLAGVLLKLGGYGFIRFFFFFVNWFFLLSFVFLWGLFMGVCGFLICFRQPDLKCLVAYLSVSHMSMLVGVFMTLKFYSLFGFIMMMIGHGFSSSGLFGILGVSYARLHSRSMLIMKSNFYYVSLLGMWGFLISVSGMSCPPTVNFFSEVFLVWGLISFGSWFAVLLFCIYFFLGSLAMVHFFMILFHGKFNPLFYLGPLNLSESLFLMMHVFPLMVGFALF